MGATFIRHLLFAFVLLVAAATQAPAQLPGSDDWNAIATRAELTTERGNATADTLETLRATLVGWRDRFRAAQGDNSQRIATLEAQIAAIGPPPEEGGAPEAPELVERRRALEAQLVRLQAPRRETDEAFTRADGLIREIDRIVAAREAAAVRLRGPSPLDPSLWPEAWARLGASFAETGRETVAAAGDVIGQAAMRDRLPAAVFYFVIAVLLVVRGRAWMERASNALYAGRRLHGSEVYAFLVSVLQIALPVLGLLALRQAIGVTGISGDRALFVADAVPVAGLALFGAFWLSVQVFPRLDTAAAPLTLPAALRRRGRAVVRGLGIVLAASIVLRRLAELDRYDAATAAVTSLPLIASGGLMLLLLGNLVRAGVPRPGDIDAGDPSDAAAAALPRAERGYLARSVVLLGRAAVLAGIAAPVLAAAGYTTAATRISIPPSSASR